MIGSSTAMPSARILRSPLRASVGHRALAPDAAREVEQRELGRGELDVLGQLVFGCRDAVARFAQVVGVGASPMVSIGTPRRRRLSLSRSNIFSSASSGAPASRCSRYPETRREDRVLGQALLGRHQGDHEVDKALLRRVLRRALRARPHPRRRRMPIRCRIHRRAGRPACTTAVPAGRRRGCRSRRRASNSPGWSPAPDRRSPESGGTTTRSCEPTVWPSSACPKPGDDASKARDAGSSPHVVSKTSCRPRSRRCSARARARHR